MKIIERTFNAETGETIDIERDESAQETKARLDAEKIAQDYAKVKAEQDAKKAALLVRLGLTEDELQTILG
jgi:hypothetical protein